MFPMGGVKPSPKRCAPPHTSPHLPSESRCDYYRIYYQFNSGLMLLLVLYFYLIAMYTVTSSFTDRDYRDLNLKAERGRIELSSAIRRFSQVRLCFVISFKL